MEPDSKASANRIVWDLAWPIIALNSMQVINRLLDTRFISSLGQSALNASGASQSVLFFLASMGIALGVGVTALVSRFYGANEVPDLVKAARQSTGLSLLFGVAIAVLGYLTLPWICSLYVDPTSPAYNEMLRYLGAVMVGIPAFYIFNSLAASLRAISDTKTPMVVSGIQIVLHIILNYVLIFPPSTFLGMTLPGANMGIAGAGWAFSISAWAAALMYFPASGRSILGATWKLQFPEWHWVVRTLRISLRSRSMGKR